MLKLDSPLQLSPIFKPKIWGRSSLSPIFELPCVGKTTAPATVPIDREALNHYARIGEVWITDDESRFLNGPLEGVTLSKAWQGLGSELHGVSWPHPRFPILAKYIFTSDWLSVQVHPDDEYARLHDPGNLGKCEMWYVVDVDEQAEILAGVKEGVSCEALRGAFERGSSRELLRSFHPESGEAVFVPPGLVHALGPGLVLFEVEENSDLTYRLDDFGRLGLDGKPRPLHLDKGLDVMRPELPTCRRLSRVEFPEEWGQSRYVLASRFFAVEELTVEKVAPFRAGRERVEVISLLAGKGWLETASGPLRYQTGDTWLVPPQAEPYRIAPQQRTRFLKFYVPDLENDFRRPLAERGASEEVISQIVVE